MNSVLSGLTGTRCFVYLDDIAINARSLTEHGVKLRELLRQVASLQTKVAGRKVRISPERSELFRSPNYGGRGATGPSKGGGNRAILHPHQSETVESFLQYLEGVIPLCGKIIYLL
jgi:hypothetical protein